MRGAVEVPDLGLRRAHAAKAVAGFGRFRREGKMLGQMAIELRGEVETSLDLGPMARLQQLRRRELLRYVPHGSLHPASKKDLD